VSARIVVALVDVNLVVRVLLEHLRVSCHLSSCAYPERREPRDAGPDDSDAHGCDRGRGKVGVTLKWLLTVITAFEVDVEVAFVDDYSSSHEASSSSSWEVSQWPCNIVYPGQTGQSTSASTGVSLEMPAVTVLGDPRGRSKNHKLPRRVDAFPANRGQMIDEDDRWSEIREKERKRKQKTTRTWTSVSTCSAVCHVVCQLCLWWEREHGEIGRTWNMS